MNVKIKFLLMEITREIIGYSMVGGWGRSQSFVCLCSQEVFVRSANTNVVFGEKDMQINLYHKGISLL